MRKDDTNSHVIVKSSFINLCEEHYLVEFARKPVSHDPRNRKPSSQNPSKRSHADQETGRLKTPKTADPIKTVSHRPTKPVN